MDINIIRNFYDIYNSFNKTFVLENFIDNNYCNELINESNNYADKNGWKTNRHNYFPTTDNEITKEWSCYAKLSNKIEEILIPKYTEIFQLEENINLKIKELFVVKYDVNNQKELDLHRDSENVYSFVIALNNEYEGGGTYFMGNNETIKINTGDVVLFSGSNFHQGKEITKGERYIITGWLEILYNNNNCDITRNENYYKEYNTLIKYISHFFDYSECEYELYVIVKSNNYFKINGNDIYLIIFQGNYKLLCYDDLCKNEELLNYYITHKKIKEDNYISIKSDEEVYCLIFNNMITSKLNLKAKNLYTLEKTHIQQCDINICQIDYINDIIKYIENYEEENYTTIFKKINNYFFITTNECSNNCSNIKKLDNIKLAHLESSVNYITGKILEYFYKKYNIALKAAEKTLIKKTFRGNTNIMDNFIPNCDKKPNFFLITGTRDNNEETAMKFPYLNKSVHLNKGDFILIPTEFPYLYYESFNKINKYTMVTAIFFQ